MNTVQLVYRFALQTGKERVFKLVLDRDTAELVTSPLENPPDWTRLEFNQCVGCPLKKETHPHCPVALNLAQVIDEFSELVSYDKVRVTTDSEERSVTALLSAQQALASLIGLLMAASDCPRMAIFRPMARFHLPFSSEAETAYRVAAMYLLAQHFLAREGHSADLELKQLPELYRGVHSVNRGITQRLRAATKQDAIINAVVLLDLNTSLVPSVIHEILDEIKPAFAGLLAAHAPAQDVEPVK
jgi:hypothetical protein